MKNNDFIAVIYTIGTLFVLGSIVFYYVLYIFLKSGDGKHTSKGIEQTERYALLRKVMKEREDDPSNGYKPIKMNYGPNSYPTHEQLYPSDDSEEDHASSQVVTETQPKQTEAKVETKPKLQATELDSQADPKEDVLVNADGEPILTKDLNRPSFQEIADDKEQIAPLPVDNETESSDESHEESDIPESSSSTEDQQSEPTDWEALFKAAAQLVDNK